MRTLSLRPRRSLRTGFAAAFAVAVVTIGAAASCDSRADLCAKSCACGTLGRCGANEKGQCVPTQPEHCARSSMCKLTGQCTFANGTCVAGSEDDCNNSKGCETMKACTLRGSVCVVAPAEKKDRTPRRRH